MFDVNFYIFSKKNNSTKTPDGSGTSFDCNIRNVSNILNPSIELRHQNPSDFNYCYIDAFHRYYFISNWTWTNGLWIASCTVDVLGSYKTQIGSVTKNVTRSASNKNGTLVDNIAPVTTAFTNNYVHNMPYPNQSGSAPSLSNGVYVVGVLGNNSGGQTMFELLPSQFQSLLSSLLTTADGYDWGDLTRGVINSLMNPFQYITSCRWYPNEFVTSGSDTVKCGLWSSDVTGYHVAPLTDVPYASFFIPIAKHPQTNARGDYMNLSPFTQTMLDASVFGLIDIDTTALIGANYIGIRIFVDPYSGIGTIKGYAETSQLFTFNKILFKKDVQFGVNVPLSSNDANAVPSILTSALGLATGTIDFGSIGSAISSLNGQIDSTASSGSITQHLNGFNLHQIFRNQVEIDYTNKGYPLMRNVVLNTLSGYILCDDGNVDLNCTDTEKEKIKQYLENGFYYE